MVWTVLNERCQFHCHFINRAYITGFGYGFTGVCSVIRLSAAAEAFVSAQLERGFRTLDFYKSVRCMDEPS